MNSSLNKLIKFGTMRLVGLLEDLSTEEWFAQPEGFANNIAWNAGHLLLVRHNLVYRSAGLDAGAIATMSALYKPGSSPADWENQPDSDALLALIKSSQEKLEADFTAGVFENVAYNAFEIGGTPMSTVQDGGTFSLWHEGLHMGAIMSIRDVLRQ